MLETEWYPEPMIAEVAVTPHPPGLRARTRRAVQSEIGAAATRLFLAQGFDATTMEQIAREAGVSRRSLFRYFSTKEDIVLGKMVEEGLAVRDALEARPASEPPWDALRAAFASLTLDPAYSAERNLRLSRMVCDTPSLHASHLEKQLRWQELLIPNIQMRLGGAPGDASDPRARAIVASAVTCLNVAIEIWVQRNGAADIAQLYDQAVAAVRG